MRGLAVVVMIQCHAFNSFARLDVREGGPYIFSQFVGGMAAPLFLFMAGMTFAFQMDSLERRQPHAGRIGGQHRPEKADPNGEPAYPPDTLPQQRYGENSNDDGRGEV